MNENGETVSRWPEGDFRIRNELTARSFVIGETNHCTRPGVPQPWLTAFPAATDPHYTIAYSYDALNRLTAATYDSGEFFQYAYDAVGNRLNEATQVGSTDYVYDDANRLVDAGGVAFTWDNNGNLLGDGVSSYAYDTANRLSQVVQGGVAYSFAYNGLGDRVQQTVGGAATSYTLDLNTGLTQVLADGASTYLYGLGRIGQQSAEWAYHLPDALGSMRQVADAAGTVS